MTDACGKPTHRNSQYVAFTNYRTAVRFDRPEVLFYSQTLAPHVETRFKMSKGAKPDPKKG